MVRFSAGAGVAETKRGIGGYKPPCPPNRRGCAGTPLVKGRRSSPPQSIVRAIARTGRRKSLGFIGVPSVGLLLGRQVSSAICSSSSSIRKAAPRLSLGFSYRIMRIIPRDHHATLSVRKVCAPQASTRRSKGQGHSTILGIIFLDYAGGYVTLAKRRVCRSSSPEYSSRRKPVLVIVVNCRRQRCSQRARGTNVVSVCDHGI